MFNLFKKNTKYNDTKSLLQDLDYKLDNIKELIQKSLLQQPIIKKEQVKVQQVQISKNQNKEQQIKQIKQLKKFYSLFKEDLKTYNLTFQQLIEKFDFFLQKKDLIGYIIYYKERTKEKWELYDHNIYNTKEQAEYKLPEEKLDIQLKNSYEFLIKEVFSKK